MAAMTSLISHLFTQGSSWPHQRGRGHFKHLSSKKEYLKGFSSGSDGKESACSVEDPGSILGSVRSPREGNGYPRQYSCLDNSMDRGTWWATVHGVAKSWTRLSNSHFNEQQSGILGDFLFIQYPLPKTLASFKEQQEILLHWVHLIPERLPNGVECVSLAKSRRSP